MKLTFKRKANFTLQDIVPQKVISNWVDRDNTKVSILTPEWIDFLHNAMWKKKLVTVTIEWESATNENQKTMETTK
jgi:hypothetical protein